MSQLIEAIFETVVAHDSEFSFNNLFLIQV